MTVLTNPLTAIDDAAREALFSEARTVNNFAPTPVTDAQLEEIWSLAKMGPTAANTQPMRVLYVRSPEAKQRLLGHLAEGNVAKSDSAPVVAVLAYDSQFHEYAETTTPFIPGFRDVLEENEPMREGMGRFSATLQIGTFILAVRSVGLAAGPMAGFDNAGVDAEFFADGRWKSLLVVNIGHPGENAWFDRLPRLKHDQAITFA